MSEEKKYNLELSELEIIHLKETLFAIIEGEDAAACQQSDFLLMAEVYASKNKEDAQSVVRILSNHTSVFGQIGRARTFLETVYEKAEAITDKI